jgi:hypothetical protein
MREVYQAYVEDPFKSANPQQTKQILSNRPPIQMVNMTGIYMLALNSHMLVRHFEMIHVTDVEKGSVAEYLL